MAAEKDGDAEGGRPSPGASEAPLAAACASTSAVASATAATARIASGAADAVSGQPTGTAADAATCEPTDAAAGEAADVATCASACGADEQAATGDRAHAAAGDREAGEGAGAAVEPRWLSEDETQAWRAVSALVLMLPGVLDAQLQRDSGLTLFEYFVLSYLSMAEGRSLRMSELAELANGSLSRLSNVAKRLEQRGWIRREPDPGDGRYTIAILTEAGWQLVVQAAPGHVETVRRFVIDPLNGNQIRSLRTIGRRIIEEVNAATGSSC
jgi:DNA-binding MarR family transcriptional regulator